MPKRIILKQYVVFNHTALYFVMCKNLNALSSRFAHQRDTLKTNYATRMIKALDKPRTDQ